MIKLLNASFTRLRKTKIFWLLTIFSILFAFFMINTKYSDMKLYNEVIEVEQLMINYSTIVGIVIAIFTSLFLGVEYSDGTIRNKIIIGHKRANIYLSNLLTVIITSLFSYILFIAVISAIGIPLFGGLTMKLSTLLKIIGCIFMTIISFSSIYTFIAMLISNKTITAITCIMLTLGMMMISVVCFNVINAEPTIPQGYYDNGELKYEQVQNPRYPSELKRNVYQTIVDILPSGQMFQIAGRTTANLKVLPLYSLVVFIVFTGTGIILFNKKDLR